MLLRLPPLPMLLPLPRPAPQPFRQHPSPQCLGVHLYLVLARQVLTGQCRSESFPYCPTVLLPQQPHYLRPKLLRLGSIRSSPRAAVLQSRRTLLFVSPPDPRHLPVAQTQDRSEEHT